MLDQCIISAGIDDQHPQDHQRYNFRKTLNRLQRRSANKTVHSTVSTSWALLPSNARYATPNIRQCPQSPNRFEVLERQ